jgi:hypothetical protein
MLSEALPFALAFSSGETMALMIVAMGVGFVTIVSLTGIIIPAWAGVAKSRLETALKQQMLERGMSAGEIVAVLGAPAPDKSGVDYAFASEAVVERDGDWCPALVLRRDADRFLVHYVGEDMSENQWVAGDRIRVRPDSEAQGCSPWDWMSRAAASDSSHWCANRSKPAPMDAEV